MTGEIDSKKRNREIEILAPAGSYDCFRAAVRAGADAVYAGGPRFGARAYADNFSEEELRRAVREAHLHGCRFYLTVNTLLKEEEMDGLYEYLAPLYEEGLDAVIVQDIGVFDAVRTWFPEMDLHASTQMTVTNVEGARFLEQRGARRIVPARELSLEEVRQIHDGTGLEVECFVHGALCYCYSGQCLLSSIIGGRSGNRGQCAQPCRLPYTAGGKKRHYLSLKDICTLELIPELVEAGIDSFKIEGRMKGPEYVAAVTAMYRKYTDLYLSSGRKNFSVRAEDREMLMDLYNRGGSHTGYYERHNGREMISLDRPNHEGVDAVRMTEQRGREVRGTALTELHRGDVIRIGGGKENYTLGSPVEKGGSVTFLVPKGVRFERGAVFRRIRNGQLLKELDEKYVSAGKQEKIHGFLSLFPSCPAVLTVICREVSFTAESEECVTEAQKRPLEEKDVRSRIMKTGNSPFCFETLEISMDEGIFLPVQQLNGLRRAALAGLEEALAEIHRRNPGGKTAFPADPQPGSGTAEERPEEPHAAEEPEDRKKEGKRAETVPFSVLTEKEEQLDALRDWMKRKNGVIQRIYPECSMAEDFFRNRRLKKVFEELREEGIEVFPAMPHIFRKKAADWAEREYDAVRSFPMDGLLIRNYDTFQFLIEHGFDKPVILDHNLYVFNRYGKGFWKREGAAEFTAPLELNEGELGRLGIGEAEMIVYGRIPVMISSQCVVNTVSGCAGVSGVTVLTDRCRKQFPVRNCCEFCYNIIYNSAPLYLGTQAEKVTALSPKRLRLQFSVERGEEVKKMLVLSEQAFLQGQKAVPEFAYTQGHFKRGII